MWFGPEHGAKTVELRSNIRVSCRCKLQCHNGEDTVQDRHTLSTCSTASILGQATFQRKRGTMFYNVKKDFRVFANIIAFLHLCATLLIGVNAFYYNPDSQLWIRLLMSIAVSVLFFCLLTMFLRWYIRRNTSQ
jgi:hypothetical protein